ncbi:hypothetical protein JCM10213_006892 [Rhodosporidiobolus nylandii]
MPPRTRRRASPASAPAEPAPAPAPAVPPSISTPTIHLEAGHPPGYAVQANLFFASEAWTTPLRKDVDALLAVFARAWEAAAARSEGGGEGQQQPLERAFSPFEVFRGCWEQLGWAKVHLLGVPEGPLRGRWGDAVLREFVERLKSDEEPLKQVAALFALHTFYATQTETMERLFIKLDVATLQYILSLSTKLGPHLDAAQPTSSAPPPSADVSFVLHSLLASNAFFLVPTPIYTLPPLPCVSLVDTSTADTADIAALLLGVDAETMALKEGNLREVARRAFMTAEEEDEEDEEDLRETEQQREEDPASWGAPALRSLVSSYLAAKSASSSAVPISSTFDPTLDPALAPPPPSVSSLLHPQNKLQLDVLLKAERATREAVAKLGDAAGGTLTGILAENGGGGKREGAGLLGLVGAEGEREGGNRRKRMRKGEVDEEVSGLEEFERVVREGLLQQ